MYSSLINSWDLPSNFTICKICMLIKILKGFNFYFPLSEVLRINVYYRPDKHATQHLWITLNVRGFMVSADWISWVTVTTLIIRTIHLMEWKAVLSRNAFLPSKFPICMQLLFRIAILSTMSHIEIRSRPFIEEVHEREREIFNRDVDFQARRYLSVLK